MASKDEYYQRIIASLQADISSQNKAISDLKSTVARQQKEIEALKASLNTPQKSPEPQQERISTEHLLLAVKRVCEDVIRANNEQLPMMFADKQEFESFRKSAEQRLLSADNFTTYQKTQDSRLKIIEEKLCCRFSLLTINSYNQKGNHKSKYDFNLDYVCNIFRDFEFKGCLPYITLITIIMLALFVLATINN